MALTSPKRHPEYGTISQTGRQPSEPGKRAGYAEAVERLDSGRAIQVPLSDRFENGTRSAHRVVAGYLSRAPATHVLFLIIVVTTLVLRGVDAPTATRILRHHSTNLVEMSREAPRVLFLSAFLTEQGHLIVELVQFTLILAPAERWLGTYRWLCAFVAGHVGATLATTIGIWLQARQGSASRDVLTSVDVGVSYGLVAVGGVLAYRLRRPAALGLASLLVVYYGAGVVRTGSFTDWGHVSALVIGFAIGPLLRQEAIPSPRRHGNRRMSELARAWEWLTAPPLRVHNELRHRAAILWACALLAAGAVLIVLLGTDPKAAVAIPGPSGIASASVVGRPPSCGRRCTTTIVRYSTATGPREATLVIPPRTLLRAGERLDVRVDPRAPSRVSLVLPNRRVQLNGLLGASAVAEIGGGLALALLARRLSGGGSNAGMPRWSRPVDQ